MKRKAKRSRSEFEQLRKKFGMGINQAAEYFEVTPRTIHNWDRDGAPKLVMRLLWERQGRLDAIHPDWRGFKIGVNGKLYGPNKLQVSAEYMRHWRAILRCPKCHGMPPELPTDQLEVSRIPMFESNAPI